MKDKPKVVKIHLSGNPAHVDQVISELHQCFDVIGESRKQNRPGGAVRRYVAVRVATETEEPIPDDFFDELFKNCSKTESHRAIHWFVTQSENELVFLYQSADEVLLEISRNISDNTSDNVAVKLNREQAILVGQHLVKVAAGAGLTIIK